MTVWLCQIVVVKATVLVPGLYQEFHKTPFTFEGTVQFENHFDIDLFWTYMDVPKYSLILFAP